jgi:CRP-like cAMP-binding protein
MPLRQISTVPPCRPLPPMAAPTMARGRSSDAVAPGGEATAAVRMYATECRGVAAGSELVAEFDDCDAIYFVVSGWMVLKRILEDGRQQVLDFVLPGSFVGDPTGRSRYATFSIEALTDAEVAVVPQRRLPDLLRSVPSLTMDLLQSVHGSLANAYDSLTDVGRRTAREAVASFLYRMDRRIRQAMGSQSDGTVAFPLTQAMVADALGLTAEHVCRMLRALKTQGIVSLDRQGLRISDRERLADLAGIMPEFEDDEPALRLAS